MRHTPKGVLQVKKREVYSPLFTFCMVDNFVDTLIMLNNSINSGQKSLLGGFVDEIIYGQILGNPFRKEQVERFS